MLKLANCCLLLPFEGESLQARGHIDLGGTCSHSLIDLSVAQIQGDLRLNDCRLGFNLALELPDIRHGAPLFCGGIHAHSIFMANLHCYGRACLDAAVLSGILKAADARIEAYACIMRKRSGNDSSTAKPRSGKWDYVALSATDATIDGAVILGEEARVSNTPARFHSYGQVNLSNSRLDGDLICTNAEMRSAYYQAPSGVALELAETPGGEAVLAALNVSRAKISGAVFLDGKFESFGEVRFNSVTVRGAFRCHGASMNGALPQCPPASDTLAEKPDVERALALSRAEIGNMLVLNSGFNSFGTVDLRNATIKGDLDCAGGTFYGCHARKKDVTSDRHTQPVCLAVSGAVISGSVFLTGVRVDADVGSWELEERENRASFRSRGLVRFRGTRIERNLHLEGGLFSCVEDTRVHPRTSQRTIGAAKSRLRHLRPSHPTPPEMPYVALFQTVMVAGTTFLAARDSPEDASATRVVHFKGSVSFEGMRTNVWEDDQAAWPQCRSHDARCPPVLELDGLIYQRLRGPIEGPKRLFWLLHQPAQDLTRSRDGKLQRGFGFKTQPWEQCARVLYDMGYRPGARFLYRKEQEYLRARGGMTLFPRIYNALLGMLVGHGFRPQYALYWAVSLFVMGSIFFDFAKAHNQITPADTLVLQSSQYKEANSSTRATTDNACKDARAGRIPPIDYPKFDPFLYSVDVLLPVVEIRQEHYWITTDLPARCVKPAAMRSRFTAMLEGLPKPVLRLLPHTSSLAAVVLLVFTFLLVLSAMLRDEARSHLFGGRHLPHYENWRRLHRRSIKGNLGWIERFSASVSMVRVIALGLIFFCMGFAALDLYRPELSSNVIMALDNFFENNFRISFAHFWMVWQTMWGWVLVSAIIAGLSTSIFRRPEA
jgi:hypothetical protein